MRIEKPLNKVILLKNEDIKFCGVCGTKNPIDHIFCVNCGFSFESKYVKTSKFQKYEQEGLTEPIRLRSMRSFLYLMCSIMLFFISFGVMISSLDNDNIFGLFPGIFLAVSGVLGTIFWSTDLLNPFTKVIVLDKDGLYSQRYDIKVSWADFKSVAFFDVQGYKFLCASVDKIDKYQKEMPFTNSLGSYISGTIFKTLPGKIESFNLLIDNNYSKYNTSKDMFNLFWTQTEFYPMRIEEVKNIIVNESKNLNKNE
jgi:hypothetical protein